MDEPRWKKLLGIKSPSVEAREFWEEMGQSMVEGIRAAEQRVSSLDPYLPRQQIVEYQMSDREKADIACGWTHCNDCCGPCPTCGLEGAGYGDPDR